MDGDFITNINIVSSHLQFSCLICFLLMDLPIKFYWTQKIKIYLINIFTTYFSLYPFAFSSKIKENKQNENKNN